MLELFLKESIEVMYKHVDNRKNLNEVVLEKFIKESIEVMHNHMNNEKKFKQVVLESIENLENHEVLKMKVKEA